MATSSGSQLLSQRVVDAVADAENAAPTELSPLAESIDPDALDALFDSDSRTAIELRFEYRGHTVLVDDCGVVRLA